jgi:hypothetical protein
MKHTKIFHAEDAQGNYYTIDEYIAFKESKIYNNVHEVAQERFLYLNSSLVKYNEEDNTFIVVDENIILRNVE